MNFLFLSCAGLWQLVVFSCGFCKKQKTPINFFFLFLAGAEILLLAAAQVQLKEPMEEPQ